MHHHLSTLLLVFAACGQAPTAPTPPESEPIVRARQLVDSLPHSQIASSAPQKRSFAKVKLPDAKTTQKLEDFCLEGPEESCQQRALDTFYEKLILTASQESGAVTRITQLGDSIINSDYISSATKQKLQQDFGDGGRGYIFAGSPKFYYLADVSHSSSGWVFKSVITPQIKDQLYGIGGTAFLGTQGATATFETSKKELGQKVSKATVYYLRQPKSGELEVFIEGKSLRRFNTEGTSVEAAQEELLFEEGPHKLQVKVSQGNVRVFGVALETKGPGIVYDAIGQLSNTVFSMLRANEDHWKAQLLLRQPDLVVFSFGANDAGYVGTSRKAAEDYASKQASLLRRVKAANPKMACLLFSPMDDVDGTHKLLAEAQRKAAKEVGCAFWDTRAYMGGEGAAVAWKRKGYLAGDGIHPSVKGGKVLGEAFAEAIEVGLADYIARASK
jgi:lysophospholipase L1-like esterase